MGDLATLKKHPHPLWRNSPQWAGASLLSRLHDHTQTQHTLDFSGRVISPMQRPLNVNTQHSQQTNIHAAGEIRTHNLRKRAAADQRVRPRGRRIRSYSFVFLLFAFYLIIILYLSWGWATSWPVPVSRIQKSLQRSAIFPSASWGIAFHCPG